VRPDPTSRQIGPGEGLHVDASEARLAGEKRQAVNWLMEFESSPLALICSPGSSDSPGCLFRQGGRMRTFVRRTEFAAAKWANSKLLEDQPSFSALTSGKKPLFL